VFLAVIDLLGGPGSGFINVLRTIRKEFRSGVLHVNDRNITVVLTAGLYRG